MKVLGRRSPAGEKQNHEAILLGSSGGFWFFFSRVLEIAAAALEARLYKRHHGFHGGSQRRVRVPIGPADLGRARYPRKSSADRCGLGGGPRASHCSA